MGSSYQPVSNKNGAAMIRNRLNMLGTLCNIIKLLSMIDTDTFGESEEISFNVIKHDMK